ncbi:MAG: sigma-54-dependent Fis family transcriptional regulator [Calditrichaeota bacterium]|nr:sigma-54-dependent Fis family transcriptional regulator [Calditrichota bacterium]
MQGRGNVLVVEDDPIVRRFLEIAIKETDCTITSVSDGKRALNALARQQYDLVFTDLKLPQVSGLQVLEYVKKKNPNTDVVIGTGYGSIENAVEAMQKGAFNYLTKPYSMKDIHSVIRQALSFRKNNKDEKSSDDRKKKLEHLGRAEQMKRIIDLICKVAPTRATILVEGETGVGKEVVADAIHFASDRNKGPYVKVNCAALPDTLAESELFGYEKGAFTGAHLRRKGRFEEANGGTLLLDEIGELSLPMQAKLLRVLQSKSFERLGSNQNIRVDVRVMATTNRDLRKEVMEGRFRKDLYFRLNVVKINVPPLRERSKDISFLVHDIFQKICQDFGLDKKLSSKAIERLVHYDWPGNVRELENTLEKAIVTSSNDVIRAEDLQFSDEHGDLIQYLFETEDDLTIYEAEKKLIMKTLEKYGHNKSKTANVLGITAKTLRNKLNEYGDRVGEENTHTV